MRNKNKIRTCLMLFLILNNLVNCFWNTPEFIRKRMIPRTPSEIFIALSSCSRLLFFILATIEKSRLRTKQMSVIRTFISNENKSLVNRRRWKRDESKKTSWRYVITLETVVIVAVIFFGLNFSFSSQLSLALKLTWK